MNYDEAKQSVLQCVVIPREGCVYRLGRVVTFDSFWRLAGTDEGRYVLFEALPLNFGSKRIYLKDWNAQVLSGRISLP